MSQNRCWLGFLASTAALLLSIGCGSETRYLPDENAGTTTGIDSTVSDAVDQSDASDGVSDSTDGAIDSSDGSVNVSDGADTTDAGDGTENTDGTDATSGPGGYLTLTFAVDDSANKTYDQEDGLAWKGSFSYDTDDNVIAPDGAWSGPFIALWDDGPISAGGHEAEGQSAGDHIWSVAVQMESPGTDVIFEYGAIRNSIDGSDGEWIWQGENGIFTIPAGSTGEVVVEGLTIDALGWIDIRFSIDTSNINTDFMVDPPQFVEVKSSAWGWSEQTMTDDGTMDDVAGDGIYSLVLGMVTGEGTALANNGLVNPGDTPEFVFVLDDIEYKLAGVPPAAEGGAICEVRIGNEWVTLDIGNQVDGDQNTFVTVPWAPIAGVIPVNFSLDDTANKTYDESDGLRWKGSFEYEPKTRTISYDSTWSGPFAPLFDDGSWTEGGHEPIGAIAGDSIWGTTIWIDESSTETYEYGVVRFAEDGGEDEWIWTGENGSFSLNVGGQSIDTVGLTINPHGPIDLRLELDSNSLSESFSNSPPLKIEVKGSAWAWSKIPLNDDGTLGDSSADDGIYTFVLSQHIGKHDGLLSVGDQAEFVFILDDIEYKEGEIASTMGLSAYTDTAQPGADACVGATAQCSAQTIYLEPAKNNNTVVTIGAGD